MGGGKNEHSNSDERKNNALPPPAGQLVNVCSWRSVRLHSPEQVHRDGKCSSIKS